MTLHTLRRRDFLTAAGSAAALLWTGPWIRRAAAAETATTTVRFGVITDLHHGYAPDALRRLQAFMDEVQRAKPDFIIELGDFCNRPYNDPAGQEVRRVWDAFHGPRYHVLGNHDLDMQPKAQVLKAWGMKDPWYSFDAGPFHFVVLDCNYVKKGGKVIPWERKNPYGNLVPAEEMAWLEKDLAKTDKQTVIFSHQGLDDRGVTNRQEVRRVLTEANRKAGFAKVIACLCGHYHLDGAQAIDGIQYLEINSASYYYTGGHYGDDGGSRATYRDPLFALVTLDPAGKLSVAGRRSEFRHPNPHETKFPQADLATASIVDRALTFPARK